VINNPQEFRVRKQVLRDGKQRAEWVQLRKGVAYLFRSKKGCRATLLSGVQSDGATRRRFVQEPDGR
jgi:hypothetical protein